MPVSRVAAEIVSGQYGHNSGVMGNVDPNGGYWSQRRHRNTLPVWLDKAGYRTGFVGKYMNGYGSPVPIGATRACSTATSPTA